MESFLWLFLKPIDDFLLLKQHYSDATPAVLVHSYELTLVGILTGPFTFKFCFFAPLIKSVQTFSRLRTFLDVKVIRIL